MAVFWRWDGCYGLIIDGWVGGGWVGSGFLEGKRWEEGRGQNLVGDTGE